jgi:formylglycine-generating enzyme required for sulfatase activity
MKTTVLTARALLLIGMVLGALTTRLDRVDGQSVKIEPGKKTTSNPSRPAPKSRKPAVGGTKLHAAPEIEMVLVHGGSFLMGSPQNEPGRNFYEDPQHRITVRDFYIGRYEVTQAQWRAVMGGVPSLIEKGDNLPVTRVAWDEVKEFCRQLSQITKENYRLLTEAKWEYACRAETAGAYAGGLDDLAWYGRNSGSKPHPVGQKRPNAFGINDMHGNVQEWCEDDWHPSYGGILAGFERAPTDGSAWVGKTGRGNSRVTRGGHWNSLPSDCRSAKRASLSAELGIYNVGFRVAKDL